MVEARKLFDVELKVINVGLEIFYNSLQMQNVKAVDVNWKPAPKLDEESEDILDKIL
ncbi:MAG: fdrA domain protein [Nitrososphaera sp.]